MRRPLKPFVTEYKGTRRQAPSQPASEPTSKASEFRAFESERSRPKPVDAPRENLEDSYEAAMRAADALFARPAPQPAQRPVASEEAAETPGTVASPLAPDRGGRILRALDEPPPAQLLALEAAHAPKRRGRKPGSKNKPKIKPLETASGAYSEVPTQSGHLPGGLSEHPAPIVAQAAQGDTPAMRRLKAIPAAPSPSNGSLPNGSKRFSWVRDRLKPGEGWKRRRLPRICW